MRAEHRKAQVHAQGGEPNNPQRRARHDQWRRGELRATRKHKQGHGTGLYQAQTRVGKRHTRGDTPRGNARRDRQHVANPFREGRVRRFALHVAPDAHDGSPADTRKVSPMCTVKPFSKTATGKRLPPARCNTVRRKTDSCPSAGVSPQRISRP